MVFEVLNRRTVKAAGSVMDVYPAGDYSEYMPKGTVAQRLGSHWMLVGKRLHKAVNRHAAKHATR